MSESSIPLTTDVLVVGSGGAGLRAAIAAAEAGQSVLVMAKGKADRSGASLLAGANVSADVMCDGRSLYEMGLDYGDKDDSQDKWYRDIIHEGFYLNDRDLVRRYVELAPKVVRELVESGMKLADESEGGRQIGVPGASILDYLYKRAKAAGVTFCENTMLLDLLKSADGVVCGGLFLRLYDGELVRVGAKAVVLATGGMHGCYSFNSGTSGLCGAGQASAIRAGAAMTQMEMVTFCPDVICAPAKYRGSIIPYIIQCFGFGRLLNGKGERFLHKYMSDRAVDLALHTEWNKLLLCYAMDRELNAGLGNADGGVTFSLNDLTDNEWDRLYTLLPELKKGMYKEIMALNEQNRGISVYAAGHYFDGGILVDDKMAATLPGLFAGGECAGGLFGANRVGAATTQMLVQGLQAGESAAAFAAGNSLAEPDYALLERVTQQAVRPFTVQNGEDPRGLRKAVVDTITRSAGVVREYRQMMIGLDNLEWLNNIDVSAEGGRAYNRPWIDWLEARDMIQCGKAILSSSFRRDESRGVFIRSDCMFTDDRTLTATIYQNGRAIMAPVEQGDVAPDPVKRDYFENLEEVITRLSYGGEE